MIAIMGLLFVINWISTRYASDEMIGLLGDDIIAKIVEAVARTGIIVVLGLIMIYYTKISKEINEIIDKIIGKERLNS